MTKPAGATAFAEEANTGPVAGGQRVQELDVLRGVALFGVFLVNMISAASTFLMGTEAQLLALPTAALDGAVFWVLRWLVSDKANTLFAFLFGLGFYLQMQRISARGVDFERLYRRRLTVLLVFGLLHMQFVFIWDILHVYAIAGFALLAMRGVSNRTLLVGGLLLAMFGRTAQEALVALAGLEDWHGLPSVYGDAAILARQALSQAGDYPGLVRNFTVFNLVDWLLSGMMIGWLLYALGRFMLGAWVGRHGWLQNSARFLPGFRRVLRLTLPSGLIAEGFARMLDLYDKGGRLPEWEHWTLVAHALHLVAVPVLATGYGCAIVVALHTPTGRRLLSPFAYAGRMALSCYVAQSFIIALVLFGVPPGLALAGHIGTTAVLGIVITAYALQIGVCRWWLARFRYGPLEWAWRGLTYGHWPPLRQPATVAGTI